MLSLGCSVLFEVCKMPWLTLWQTPWLTVGLPVHALLKAARWDLSKVQHWLQITFLGSLSRGEPLSESFTSTDIPGSGLIEEKQSFLAPTSQVLCTAIPLLYKQFSQ